MKITLDIRDDLFLRAKAKAALAGISLGRFLESSFERTLQEDSVSGRNWGDWARSLPSISREAAEDLERTITESDFREIEPDMWS